MDYRTIVERIRDAIVVVDAAGTIVFANEAAERMLGYAPGSLTGRPLSTLLPAHQSITVNTPAETPVQRTESQPVHARLLNAQGTEQTVDVDVERTAADGQLLTIWQLRIPKQQDTDRRSILADALAAMADAFVQMTSQPDVDRIARLTVDTLVGRLGGAGARVWLWDSQRGRLELQAWAGISPTVDRGDATEPERYDLGLSEVLASRQPRVVLQTGTETPVPEWFRQENLQGYALHPLVFAEQLVGVIGYFSREAIPAEMIPVLTAFARHVGVELHDVSEQARARRQIEALASEAHARAGEFEAIVSNMPDAVFVARGGRIVFVNRTATRMLGYEDPEELYVPLEEFSERAAMRNPDGTPVPPAESIFARVLSGEVITGREQRMTNVRTGRELWVQISAAPLRDKSGRIHGGVVVATEITRLKELEHSKDEWLAIAAHELRTPLTPITVHLQMAQRRLHMGRPIDPEVFDKALEQVKRLSRLVNGLLDVTRLQAGQLDLVLEDVDLREIAENIVERVRHGAPKHTLVLDADPEPVVVRGDRARIDEVIAALVDNAIKYSPDGGEVWVTVRAAGNEAHVEVRDEGIGILPEERAQIFERYFRSGTVPQTQYGGLGLGLWLAGKIVQKHGGRIDLESTPGRGSTFTVVLPRVIPAGTRAEPHPPRTKVLVVDDDLAVLDALRGLLSEEGYEVRVARSGIEAMSEARVWQPHVMLLDLRMPGMDGWEVRRRLASDPSLSGIPVVLVSADRDARIRAAGMGVQGFVAKPFDLEEIERVLRTVLAKETKGQKRER